MNPTIFQSIAVLLILQLTGIPHVFAQQYGKKAVVKKTANIPSRTLTKTANLTPAAVMQQGKSLLDATIISSMHGFDPKKNEELATKVHNFLKDPKNKSFTKTPEGKALLKAESKMVTMIALKKKLDACGKSKFDSRGLGNRILNLAGNMTPSQKSLEDAPLCVMGANSFSSLNDIVKMHHYMANENTWIHDNDKTTTGEKKIQLNKLGNNLDFERKLYLQSMKNALKTHIDLNYRYDTNEIEYKAGFVSFSVDQLCPSMKYGGQFLTNPCEDSTRKALQTEGEAYLNSLIASKAKRYTDKEVVDDLNGRLDRLNKKIKQIPSALYGITSISQVTGFRPKNAEAEKYKIKATKEYERAHWQETSSGPGLLLHTNLMKDAVDPNAEHDPKGKYKLYGKVTHAKQIQDSVSEAQRHIESQTRELNTDHKGAQSMRMPSKYEKNISVGGAESWNENVQEKLNKLVRTNPAAVAQLLVDQPEYVNIVCKTIYAIKVEDEENESTQKIWMWGGAIVGGLLLVTGVGSFVGASILAGTVEASTIATLTAVSTYSTVGSIYVGIAQTGKFTYDSVTAREEYNSYKNAWLAGNGDAQTYSDAEAAYKRYEDAEFGAILSLGLTILDVGFLKYALKGPKTGKTALDTSVNLTERTESLNRATYVLKDLSGDPKLAAVFKKARVGMTEEETGKFLAYLANLDDAAKFDVIAKMKTLDELQLRNFMKSKSGVTAFKPNPIKKTTVDPTHQRLDPSKQYKTEELDAIDTHDNPVWTSDEWVGDFKNTIKNHPDADIIANEIDLLKYDSRYSYIEKKQLAKTQQTITENNGKYATITMTKTSFGGDLKLNKASLTDTEIQSYKVSIKNGKIYSSNDTLLDTKGFNTGRDLGDNKMIYIMDEDGNIFIAGRQPAPGVKIDDLDRLVHSQLAGGKSVAGAGEIEIIDGKIISISDRSGHYLPPPRLTMQVMEELSKKGVDVSKVDLQIESLLKPVMNHAPSVNPDIRPQLFNYNPSTYKNDVSLFIKSNPDATAIESELNKLNTNPTYTSKLEQQLEKKEFRNSITKNDDEYQTISQLPRAIVDDKNYKVKYLSPTESETRLVEIKNGKFYDKTGSLIDTKDATSITLGKTENTGNAIFVMDEKGNIYLSKYQSKNQFHHSSLVGGKPVAAAGELKIENGTLKFVSDTSGHYAPPLKITMQFYKRLRELGVDLSNVDFKIEAPH